MNIFSAIEHWLKTMMFYAVKSIQIEKDRQKFETIVSSMKSVGDDFFIRTDSILIGMEYMEIG